MDSLSPHHFLSLPRPDVFSGLPAGVPDTSTLAAHDFDVDTRTGFMPPQPPLSRLPPGWEPWEATLDSALKCRLQLGDKVDLTESEAAQSASWRNRVREMPILPTAEIEKSERLLRRAHHVLAWIMHLYIHSLPPSSSICIPAPITIPHLRVSAQLRLPPVLTYSDDVLYNWDFVNQPDDAAPSRPELHNLRSQTLFTGTIDEQEFYLASARIELRGVDALAVMRATMDEAFVGDDIAARRITSYLRSLSTIIADLRALLLAVKEGCNPEVFYRDIRPWFRGADSDPTRRKWVFEGLEREPGLMEPEELSGPSAGQSSLVHALDIFLGVDQYSHDSSPHGSTSTQHSSVSRPSSSSSSTAPSSSSLPKPPSSFMKRMQTYMPRHHRAFLTHLGANSRPLRAFVMSSTSTELVEAYNEAVRSLKAFRDAHMQIVALYIIGPARRLARAQKEEQEATGTGEGEGKGLGQPLKGTGGTDLVRFLKGVRDRTADAVMNGDVGKDGV